PAGRHHEQNAKRYGECYFTHGLLPGTIGRAYAPCVLMVHDFYLCRRSLAAGCSRLDKRLLGADRVNRCRGERVGCYPLSSALCSLLCDLLWLAKQCSTSRSISRAVRGFCYYPGWKASGISS